MLTNKEKFLKKIGEFVEKERKKQNLSQYQLSYRMNFSTRISLLRLEKGKGNPTLTTVFDVCDALGVKAKDMFNELDI